MHSYLVVVEKTDENYSAYSPDVAGCVATGKTREKVGAEMQRALEAHITALVEEGLPVPEAIAVAEYVTVAT